MAKPNDLFLIDIIKFCQITVRDINARDAIRVIEELNSLLSSIKIQLTQGYDISLRKLKSCLRAFKPSLEGIECLVFFYDMRADKCIRSIKMERPCDVIETFIELYLNRSDAKDIRKLDQIILSMKQSLWGRADRLERELAYLERIQGIGGELGALVSGVIEDLTMELDEIDEKIMELDAIIDLSRSRIRETDKYLIFEREGMKGLIFMDKYMLLIIDVNKLEEIIRRQISGSRLREISSRIKNLLGTESI